MILILGQTQLALADYAYIGTGQWSTSSLTYYFYGPNGTYQSPTQAAATDWNNMTNLTVSSTAEGWEKIGVGTGDFGPGNFNGRTIICGVSGQCYSAIPINESYSYAQIDFNTANTSGWSWGTSGPSLATNSAMPSPSGTCPTAIPWITSCSLL
ncbi:MAG TPA: hypothetical protein VFM93_14505 [Candidatus Limnocylindria bacterium]|nr:hypothetical protein [Candidatus Limnocylindria bacterium]